ncbi:helix-turn-helix domain-containing protein [Streptomyces omiyaensis]|uniref:DUF6597 domain-containing transcriptional factor n=1 Tax=Streptomyces omiyaensis TaxID=68247 RepID=A0ABW7C041_9ACTN|nr:helix-turn-helix domain-containing protein [Streptomyces omiyaensis]GGY68984.1 AraC family transcriptional regulator [Streptomyces omiyaensis]
MPDPAPRRDTRGILAPSELLSRVRFRRHVPAPELRPYLEHYWLIDWALPEPYTTRVVPHPSVNVVFQRYGPLGAGPRAGRSSAEVAGVAQGLFSQRLEGEGRVCGVQFRPGGFRPFAPARPVSDWTDRRVPLHEALPGAGRPSPGGPPAEAVLPAAVPGALPAVLSAVLSPDDDHARVAALDAFLLAHGPAPDPAAVQAMELVELVRTDRAVRRVGRLARLSGLSPRSLQRLFASHVGVGPKWVILRYRLHEALERAGRGTAPDWAGLAAELGYSDQAHLVRDFTAVLGLSPTAYARGLSVP